MDDHNLSSTAGPVSTMPPSMPRIGHLFPVLVQSFLIIFLGYCAGKWHLISASGLNGIGRYTGTFALPALLFSQMLTLRFNVVDWRFLAAILLSKSVVFFVVFALTFLILRLRNDAASAVASLAAIFATQSNDFALGLPILAAVYDENFHPEFIQYVYLLAPISLVILNPIGFILLEWNGRRTESQSNSSLIEDDAATPRRSVAKMMLRVFVGVLCNPIVFMTLLGLIFNLCIDSDVTWLADLLKSLKASYGATALFLLGLTMVDRIKASFSFNNLLLPSMLIFAKLIVMPLVNRNMTSVIVESVGDTAASSAGANVTMQEELSMFGFLYGTFPTAPTVFVIAAQYGVETEMFASAIVLCTFLSAPLMYVTAWLMMFSSNLSNFLIYNETLIATGVNFAWLSIVLCVLTCIFLLVTRRFLRLPHTFTFLLSLAVLKMCVGVIWIRYINPADLIHGYTWLAGFVTYLILGGAFDARFTAALLGVSLCLVAFDVPKRGRICLAMACCCYSVSIVASVLVVHYRRPSLITPTLAFRLGVPQTVASIVIILVSIVVIAVSLLLIVRFLLTRSSSRLPSRSASPQQLGYGNLPQEESDDDVGLIAEAGDGISTLPNADTERSYSSAVEGGVDDDDPRFVRHVVLLFYIFIGSIVALFLCAWRLEIEMTMDPGARVAKLSTVFTLTEFMDYVLNYGQGLFIFALFALDTRLIVLPIYRKVRRTMRNFYAGSYAPPSTASVPRTTAKIN